MNSAKNLFCFSKNNVLKQFTSLYSIHRLKSSDYDIIITGGGLVGATMACSLGKDEHTKEKRILLLEGSPGLKQTDNEDYSNRVTALSQGTVDLMKKIDVWSHISAKRFQPVKYMQIWDALSDAQISFRSDNSLSSLAYIVENDLILRAVYQELTQCSNVIIRNESKVEKIILNFEKTNKQKIKLVSGEEFLCDLIVGGDGYNSLVRKSIGGSDISLSYEQMGVVATLKLSELSENVTAWQRFIPTGPVALLPLNNTHSSLVWSTTKNHATQLLSMEPNRFIDAINEAFYRQYKKNHFAGLLMNTLKPYFENRLNKNQQFPPKVIDLVKGSRAAFPLGFNHTSIYVKQGTVIIGDAAHRIHPMAGQGVNLGFGDVKCLTEILSDIAYKGANFGDKHHLLKYEKKRLIDNIPVMFGVHGLQRLYSAENSFIVAFRGLALNLVNTATPIKNIFISRAIR
uniref:Ubiquinone biosynthesis monooxygenase COQ6, mitochondrial n=1 Tax=Culicoides sonorensis TaxID=179676 RepID=A0A336KKH4_CULSO